MVEQLLPPTGPALHIQKLHSALLVSPILPQLAALFHRRGAQVVSQGPVEETVHTLQLPHGPDSKALRTWSPPQ